MKRFFWLAMILLALLSIYGCGGAGGPAGTGSIEGFVYVPEGGRGAIVLTRQATPPLGYIALYGADVIVEIGGRTKKVRTDTLGHFKVSGLPDGLAYVTIIPPLSDITGQAEYYALTTTMEVRANTTAYIGTDGNISLISVSADHLSVLINQLNPVNFPTVEMYFSVIDPVRNTPIIGLDPNNLEVTIPGLTLHITDFRQVSSFSLPASLCLVLDRSGSMTGVNYDDQPLEDLKAAAREFINLAANEDKIELISFANSPTVDCSFTNDKNQLNAAIDQLWADGATALYDAIWQGIEDTALQATPRKAVIAMTDGGENNSSEEHGGGYPSTPDPVINLAKTAGIPVYTIGLQGFDFTRSPGRVEERSSRPVDRMRSEQDLQRIARETGGEYFYAPQSTDLMGVYTKVTQRQQQQYSLKFQDPYPQQTGQRNLELMVRACGLEGLAFSQYSRYLYGYPVNPVVYTPGSYAGRSFYYDGIHIGEDIGLPEGTATCAIGDGRIVQYEAHTGYGELCAVVEHDLGRAVHFALSRGHTKTVDTRYICSIYGHIRPMEWRSSTRLPWRVGDTIRQGQIIGYINDDANNGDGSEHLHMGIRLTAHPGYWVYYGYESPSIPESNVRYFAAFSEVISILNQ